MNHLNKVIIAYSLFALASPATAMTVSDFLPKAEKLMSASMGAMFSKHRKPVAAEMAKVTSGYRADIEAAQRAGRKSSSCPPKKGSVNGKEFLTYLQSIPTAKRNLQVKVAFHGFMAKKYPC
ncbi:MAG: hypothetical protein Pars2KO_02530 [Parasphingorhabdus sp.]